jgi:hypothetical protein
MKYTRSKRTLSVLILIVLLSAVNGFAQENHQFGNFKALMIDNEVVDHVFSEGNDIYVKIQTPYWNNEFTVRISDGNQTGYRTWFSGDMDYTVRLHLSEVSDRQGYTYRINTGAGYVEYWVNGRMVLHLERSV